MTDLALLFDDFGADFARLWICPGRAHTTTIPGRGLVQDCVQARKVMVVEEG